MPYECFSHWCDWIYRLITGQHWSILNGNIKFSESKIKSKTDQFLQEEFLYSKPKRDDGYE